MLIIELIVGLWVISSTLWSVYVSIMRWNGKEIIFNTFYLSDFIARLPTDYLHFIYKQCTLIRWENATKVGDDGNKVTNFIELSLIV